MIRDEILKLAKDAGFEWPNYAGEEVIARLIGVGIVAEREACAKVCENIRFPDSLTAILCAAAIRARGKT